MYECHTAGEIFNPIGILWYKYEALPMYGNISQYFLDFSVSLRE